MSTPPIINETLILSFKKTTPKATADIEST